jgi:NADPH2:quinone reductase
MHSKSPVLLVGGSGIVGVRAATALRKLLPDLPLAIAARDHTKAATVARDVGGPTTSLVVDLSRDDLGLPDGSTYSAIVVFLKDTEMRTMRYAQRAGVPYIAFSDFSFDVAPLLGMFVHAPTRAPILPLGHMLGGVATLAALHFAKELHAISSIDITGVVGADDTGGPASRDDFERYAAGGHGALVKHAGAFTWLKDAAAARTIVDATGTTRTAYALPLLDVTSLAAATPAHSVRVDLAIRGADERKQHTELILDLAGTRADGTDATIRVVLTDDDVHARISAYGAALAIERLVDGIAPGLYGPETILDPETALRRIRELGVRVDVRRAMRAVAIDRYGGVDTLALRSLLTPAVGPDEVLLRLEIVGLGAWDREEREGHYAEYIGNTTFPYVLGWDAAGTIAAVGERVTRFSVGDRVFAVPFPKPTGGGLYAQFAAVNAEHVAPIPDGLSIEQAGTMGWDALTALAGMETLQVKAGDNVMVFGASGGVGHLALQLAKGRGARVFAVASGSDGVALATELGADAVVDGRKDDVLAAARRFGPIDAALFTAGGEIADKATAAVRDGGRIAFPNGVTPKPNARFAVQNFDASRTAEAFAALAASRFKVHVARVFPLEQAADAHRALEKHYVGKLALRVS